MAAVGWGRAASSNYFRSTRQRGRRHRAALGMQSVARLCLLLLAGGVNKEK